MCELQTGLGKYTATREPGQVQTRDWIAEEGA